MDGRIIVAYPVTQTRVAVEQLIAYFNHGQQPEEMPSFYRLDGEMVLVLNNKKDAYYVTTARSCSCPSSTYHPGTRCKHSLKYFPEQQTAKPESMVGDIRAALPGWPGGAHGPVEAI